MVSFLLSFVSMYLKLSVCSTSAIQVGQTAYVGEFGDFKWGGKFYEGGSSPNVM